jgi:hypothetical protein
MMSLSRRDITLVRPASVPTPFGRKRMHVAGSADSAPGCRLRVDARSRSWRRRDEDSRSRVAASRDDQGGQQQQCKLTRNATSSHAACRLPLGEHSRAVNLTLLSHILH